MADYSYKFISAFAGEKKKNGSEFAQVLVHVIFDRQPAQFQNIRQVCIFASDETGSCSECNVCLFKRYDCKN